MQPLLEEDTAHARGKKSVILALRYFSAAARDALRDREHAHSRLEERHQEVLQSFFLL
jgi:hypothetical protein